MIALRGTIRHVSQKKNTSASPDSASGADGSYDPMDTKEGDWVWTGHWAFGSLPEEDIPPAVSNKKNAASAKKKKPHAFVYKFHKISDANKITVPSSIVTSDDDEDEKSQDVNPNKTDAHGGDETGKAEKDAIANLEGKGDGKASSDQGGNSSLAGVTEKADAMEKTNEKESSTEISKDKVSAVTSAVETGGTVNRENDGATAKSHPQTKPVANEKEGEDGALKHQPNGKSSEEIATNSMQPEEKDIVKKNDVEVSVASGASKDKERDEGKETTGLVAGDEKEQRNSISSTFAFSDGAEFTDAGLDVSNKCPIAGCWKGYFENVSRRKDRMTSRVQETFHLFFNRTPPNDARMAFDLDDNEDNESDQDVTKSGDSGALPSNFIHVRGAGTNQFGTFEIIGGFNVESGVLSCQRIYVSTTDGSDSKSNKSTKDKSKETNSTPMRKSYFTRKRPVSFKRRDYGDNNKIKDTEGAGRRSSGVGRKRQRVHVPEVSSSKNEEVSVKNKGITTPAELPVPSSIAPVTSIQNAPTRQTAPAPVVKIVVAGKRPSPGKNIQIGKKSKGISHHKTSQTTNSAKTIAIPKVGHPLDARWRSAHFLYYHRHTDEADTQESTATNSAPTPVTPTKTSYVVYEGEMDVGNNIRDGKGVCLYNNNMIYEGVWKKNKEHGYGSLFTGDRNHTIYVGEWERGKMHGKGTYYYHMFTNGASLENVGKYDGEFKENSRHGIGSYTFADGSVYEGDWRDNVPCGKGIFRWQDGSVYDGHWKDGKRNGMGTLEAVDGFKYDGMWVDNAMEGKGCATYPNGQQYNGMWLNGKRDGRGTIIFGNGAVYKGRFKDDCMEGQGTLKIEHNVSIPKTTISDEFSTSKENSETKTQITETTNRNAANKDDWMIPIEFQSDIGHIHQKAGFTTGGE